MSSVFHSDRPRVLVTGLDGFTGKHLSQRLEQLGLQIFGTTHSAYLSPRADVFEVDLCDRVAITDVVAQVRPDYVIHLAAISFVAHGDADAIYRVNIMGTRNLLDALAVCEKKPKQVLLTSSANIYGNASAELIDETFVPSPTNDYAVSKLAMEYAANLWLDRLPIVIARPFNYTGVAQGEQFLIPKIVSHFKRKATVIELGNIEVERDFSDVRRVVDAYAKLLTSGIQQGVFNVCSGHAYSLGNIISLMQDIAGYEIEVKINPAFVRANEVRRLQGSCRKLVDAVGPLEEIPLRDTLDWMYYA